MRLVGYRMKLVFIHILLKRYQPLKQDQFLRFINVKTSIRVCKFVCLILTSRFGPVTKPSFWGITLRNNCKHEVLFKIGAVVGKNFQIRLQCSRKNNKFTTHGTTFVKISQVVEAGQSLKGMGMKKSLLPSNSVQPQPRPVKMIIVKIYSMHLELIIWHFQEIFDYN